MKISNKVYNNVALKHYGVKGMKWGVRKQKKQEVRIRRLAKKFERRGDKYADALRNPSTSAMYVTTKMLPYISAYLKLNKADQEYIRQTGKSYIEQMLSEDSKFGNLTVDQYLDRINEHRIAAEVDSEMRDVLEGKQ